MIISQNTSVLIPYTLKVSISNAFYNKEKQTSSSSAFTYFTSTEMTLEELAAHITSGKAVACGVFEDNYRSKSNFIFSSLMALDFDEGRVSVHDLMKDEFIVENAFLIVATPSSTPEKPRSRVYFALNQSIHDPDLFEGLLLRLLIKYPHADQSCKDRARFFYGSDTDNYHYQGQVLCVDTLSELPEPPKEDSKPHSEKKVNLSSSSPRLPINYVVREQEIRELLKYIPKQQDYHEWLYILMGVHSEFPDRQGINLIEEWSPGYPGEVEKKFNSFNPCSGITIRTVFFMALQHGWKPQQRKCKGQFHRVNTRYLSTLQMSMIEGKCTLLKSPMNTGKTTWAKQYIKDWRDKHGREPRVLIVTYRIALAIYIANIFGFVCYTDVEPQQYANILQLVCCLNSLPHLTFAGSLPKYDIVIFDEIEQSLHHLCGKTLSGNQGIFVLEHLQAVIGDAETVLAMDAYATPLSYEFLANIRESNIIYNEYQVERKPATIYNDSNALVEVLQDDLAGILTGTEEDSENGPLILLCDQKKQVIAHEKYFSAVFPKKSFPNFKMASIHSENASEPDNQRLLNNPNEESSKYHLIIASSVMGTGIDITAPVGHVYTDFLGSPLIAEELMQMIGRARNANGLSVFINRNKKKKKIRKEHWYTQYWKSLARHQRAGFYFELQNGCRNLNQVHLDYLRLYTTVVADRKNTMKQLDTKFFWLLKQRYILKEVELWGSESIAEQHQESYQLDKKKWVELVLHSQEVSTAEYYQHRKEGQPSKEIYAGYIHWQIKQTYGQDVTRKLIELWHQKGSEKLMLFLALYEPDYKHKRRDDYEDISNFSIPARGYHYKTYQILSYMLGSVFGDTLNSKEFELEELNKLLCGRFKELAIEYKLELEEMFERRTRKTQETDQMRLLLQCLVRTIGLKFVKYKGRYRIDPKKLEIMRTYAQSHIDFHNKKLVVGELHLQR